MTKERVLLMVKTDVLPEIEAEWNDWYNNQHITNRLNISGFLSVRRFVAIEGEPKYLTLYELANIDVLTSGPYLKLRDWEASLPSNSFENITLNLPNFSRGLYKEIYTEDIEYQLHDSEFISVVGYDVPSNREKEFNTWFDTEHIPATKKILGLITAFRFKAIEDQIPPGASNIKFCPKYVAIYDLEKERVIKNEVFLREIDKTWSSWVRSWYKYRFCILGKRIFPK